MSLRIPAEMVERLAAIERRLDALTDEEDGSCSVPNEAKAEVRPFLDSWVKPDVTALLAWARGTTSARATRNWFPHTRALARRKP